MKKFLFLTLLVISSLLYAESWTSTGWALKDGYIVTNFHCVDGASNIVVKSSQGDYHAKVVITDESSDLAIIKINDETFTGFGDVPYSIERKQCEVGEGIWTIGYPMMDIMGNEVKFTDGKISAKTGYKGDLSTYQITVPIHPGNSGGPLFNESGNIVGITSSGLNKQVADNVNYAIKTSYLLNLIESALSLDIIPNGTTVTGKVLTEQIQLNKKFVFQLHFNDESNGGIVLGNDVKKQPKEETIYYDENGYGVASPSFASYYKITLDSGDPQTPKRYREFAIDGTLIGEGNFISIDKQNDNNSIYDGQCYDYREGKLKLLYREGDLIKFSAYDYTNSDIVRYEIELKAGTPNGVENEYDSNGKLIISNQHKMGYKVKETIAGTTWTYQQQGNSSVLKVSTSPKVKTIGDGGVYKTLSTTNPKLTNSQEVFLYNDSDTDMLIGFRNIYAVHCTSDGSYIFPLNCAWNGKSIHRVAYYNINDNLKKLAEKMGQQALANATVVTKTSTSGTNTTKYNDGKYGTYGSGWRDSQDFLRTSSSYSTTSKTVDKALYYELLEKAEGKYNAIEAEAWDNYEEFRELLVDSIYLPAGESINKVIGFQTNFLYKYGDKDFKKFTQLMDSVFIGEHKIFVTYDIVDLNMDTVILSVYDMYDALGKNSISDYEIAKKYSLIPRFGLSYSYSSYGFTILNRPEIELEKSDLYYTSVYSFSKWHVKSDKKEEKKNPQKIILRKQKHNECMSWIFKRLKAILNL